MLRATRIVRRPAVKPERVADTLTLDHESRHRRRIALTSDGGLEILLDLDRATILGDGDAVRLEDDRLVVIKAAGQPLLEIRAETPLRLMRIAWHIGNRHTPAEITADALYIEDDHVLAEMVRGLGGTATQVTRPFQPERGAYEEACNHPDHNHGHAHGHDHGHGHGHDHGHSHDHGHAHSHASAHAHGHTHEHAHAEAHSHAHTHEHGSHEHGSACGCGHDHGEHGHGTHGHDHGHKHA